MLNPHPSQEKYMYVLPENCNADKIKRLWWHTFFQELCHPWKNEITHLFLSLSSSSEQTSEWREGIGFCLTTNCKRQSCTRFEFSWIFVKNLFLISKHLKGRSEPCVGWSRFFWIFWIVGRLFRTPCWSRFFPRNIRDPKWLWNDPKWPKMTGMT